MSDLLGIPGDVLLFVLPALCAMLGWPTLVLGKALAVERPTQPGGGGRDSRNRQVTECISHVS